MNVLVSRDGATVLFRGPNVPWSGQLDFTLEALVYGAVLGLRILVIFGTAGVPQRGGATTSCCARCAACRCARG